MAFVGGRTANGRDPRRRQPLRRESPASAGLVYVCEAARRRRGATDGYLAGPQRSRIRMLHVEALRAASGGLGLFDGELPL